MNILDFLPVSPEAQEAFTRARPAVVREVKRRLGHDGRNSEHWSAWMTDRTIRGMEMILWSLGGAMRLREPALLDDQIAWINACVEKEGIAPVCMLRSMRLFVESAEMLLSPDLIR